MAIGKDPGPLKVQIFLERRGRTRAWVPYKILIGYGRGRQVIVDDRGEHLYESMEFATREDAVSAATSRAWRTVTEKFPDASRTRVEWDVLEEGNGEDRGGADRVARQRREPLALTRIPGCLPRAWRARGDGDARGDRIMSGRGGFHTVAEKQGPQKRATRRVGISHFPFEEEQRRQHLVQKQEPAKKPSKKKQSGKVAREIKEDPAPGMGRKSVKGGKAGGTRAWLRSRKRRT